MFGVFEIQGDESGRVWRYHPVRDRLETSGERYRATATYDQSLACLHRCENDGYWLDEFERLEAALVIARRPEVVAAPTIRQLIDVYDKSRVAGAFRLPELCSPSGNGRTSHSTSSSGIPIRSWRLSQRLSRRTSASPSKSSTTSGSSTSTWRQTTSSASRERGSSPISIHAPNGELRPSGSRSISDMCIPTGNTAFLYLLVTNSTFTGSSRS